MAPAVNLLDDNLGLANTLVVIGALVLLCVPFAVSFRPLAAGNDSGKVMGRKGCYNIAQGTQGKKRNQIQCNIVCFSSIQTFEVYWHYTRTGCYLGKRFCKIFSETSTVVLQLPCCSAKQWDLSEYCSHNLLPK